MNRNGNDIGDEDTPKNKYMLNNPKFRQSR